MDADEQALLSSLQPDAPSEEGEAPTKDQQEEVVEETTTEEVPVEEEVIIPEEEETVVKLPAPKSKYPDISEGDYEKGADDQYVIKADHLASDMKDILGKDAGIFSKIFKAKPEKGEVIAKILGVKGDETRSPGKVMDDVVRAMKAGDPETSKKLLTTHFPFLVDQNVQAPFTYSESVKDLDVDLPTVEKTTKEDLENAAYRLSSEMKGSVSAEEILEDPELLEVMAKYKFDPQTGDTISSYDAMVLSMDELYGDIEVEEEDAPDPSGGMRGTNSKVLEGAENPKSAELEKALSQYS